MRILMVVLALSLVFAGQGLAAGNSSSRAVYGSPPAKIHSVVAGTKASGLANAKGAKAGSTLPFTGLDLGVILGAGFVLVGTGFSLRRLTRRPPTA
jgi:hypothetical protein